MTEISADGLDPQVGNINQLLAHRGRASTPTPPNDSKLELADMLRIAAHSSNPHHHPMNIATIVHDKMYDELEKKYPVIPLLPSCLVRSVDKTQPKTIVIHREAFHEGPWFGAEDATGGVAVETIRRLLPWSRKWNVPVIYIDNGSPDQFYTPYLREIGTQFFPSEEFFARLPEGAPRSAIYHIAQDFSQRQNWDRTEGGI